MVFMHRTISLSYGIICYSYCSRTVQIKIILRKVRFMSFFHNFLFYNKQGNKLLNFKRLWTLSNRILICFGFSPNPPVRSLVYLLFLQTVPFMKFHSQGLIAFLERLIILLTHYDIALILPANSIIPFLSFNKLNVSAIVRK
jgi:hypothetical protein